MPVVLATKETEVEGSQSKTGQAKLQDYLKNKLSKGLRARLKR
jgi:hypothetical protein